MNFNLDNNSRLNPSKKGMDFKNINDIRCAGFVVICKSEKKVLLVSTHEGNWGFPKGKKNKKEALIDCAYRELKEETGLKAVDIEPVDIDSVFFDEITKKGKPSVRLYVATTQTLIKPKIEDVDELSKAEWVDIDKASKILVIKNRKEILDGAIKKIFV